jgi:hypothetical protein
MRAERRPDGAVLLNKIAADAVHVHLEWAQRLPNLAREVGDSRIREITAIQQELAAVTIDTLKAENEELRRQKWSFAEKIGAVTGGGIVGVAIGVIVAWRVSK